MLGIGASLAANILAADPSWAGRAIAAWPPVALLLTVELLSRVPVTPGRLSRVRVSAAALIAGIAAWVSYWHMVEVAEAVGEASVAAHLLPFSVDGLVVVASVCLVEISDRQTSAGEPPATATTEAPSAPLAGDEPGQEAATSPAEPKKPSGPEQAKPTERNGSSAADSVRRLAAEHPEWTQAELAEAAGCSIRTVRRHLATSSTELPAETEEPSGPVIELVPEYATQTDEELA